MAALGLDDLRRRRPLAVHTGDAAAKFPATFGLSVAAFARATRHGLAERPPA